MVGLGQLGMMALLAMDSQGHIVVHPPDTESMWIQTSASQHSGVT